MKNSVNYTLIENYLEGNLSKNELTEFEIMINQSSELASELRFQQELMEAIHDERKREIRATLNQVHNERKPKLSIDIYSWKLQAVAAAVVLLLFVSGGIFGDFFANKPLNETLYSEYFSPENSILSVRTVESDESRIQEGMYYYEQGEFEQAISIFKAEPNDLIGKLYTGFSLMKLEHYDQAEVQFIAIIDHKDNLIIDQAEWNLGLCYLIAGKSNQAEELFTQIANGNTVYNKDASDILAKMSEE